ncbi:MAG: AmmeMemoRadiSam system protein B [Spirochaetales bacterium]|jgi:AmmeMemoRadiSam system protein B|nr:AmmeMemoRadiSam system protein B [Spirochaetales bacterium]
MNGTPPEKIRPPLVEGLFYPEDPAEIDAALSSFETACGVPRGKALAIVTPHAAWEKAGNLMASAFLAAADRKIRTAVLIGPVHRDFTDEIILPESEVFSIPTGAFRVDTQKAEELLSCGTRFVRSDIPHLEEHCLETQLPFLLRYFPGVKILPVLLGKDTAANIKALGSGLYISFSADIESTLFIVTTNLCESREDAKARAEADEICALAEKKDSSALAEGKLSRHFTACGAGCLAAVLKLPGAGPLRILGRAWSASDAQTGRRVEYAAMAMEAS